jgi:hypothetical protein
MFVISCRRCQSLYPQLPMRSLAWKETEVDRPRIGHQPSNNADIQTSTYAPRTRVFRLKGNGMGVSLLLSIDHRLVFIGRMTQAVFSRAIQRLAPAPITRNRQKSHVTPGSCSRVAKAVSHTLDSRLPVQSHVGPTAQPSYIQPTSTPFFTTNKPPSTQFADYPHAKIAPHANADGIGVRTVPILVALRLGGG